MSDLPSLNLDDQQLAYRVHGYYYTHGGASTTISSGFTTAREARLLMQVLGESGIFAGLHLQRYLQGQGWQPIDFDGIDRQIPDPPHIPIIDDRPSIERTRHG